MRLSISSSLSSRLFDSTFRRSAAARPMKSLILLACAAVAAAQSLAIRNVSVLDMTGAPVRAAATVLVSGSKIAAVGKRIPIPAGAQIVDGTGKFLIPGLWDMHVHLWEQDPMLALYVVHGVTGVRDMGSDFRLTKKWRDEVAAGKRIGPRIMTSGSPLDGRDEPGSKIRSLRITNPEQARSAVDGLDESGVDFINVLSAVDKDSYDSLAQRARMRRLPLAGHVPDYVALDSAVDARQKSMEHLFGVPLACSPLEPTLRSAYTRAVAKGDRVELEQVRRRITETFSVPVAESLFRRLSMFGVWQCPTLSMLKRTALPDVPESDSEGRLRYVPASVRAGWKHPTASSKGADTGQLHDGRSSYELSMRIVGMMARSGVGLLAGTDTGNAHVVPGWALHQELALLVAAGLTSQQALASATVNAARYFGDESSGTIERGKKADLILLRANPLLDIRNTEKISAVVLGGKLLGRNQLDAMLAAQ